MNLQELAKALKFNESVPHMPQDFQWNLEEVQAIARLDENKYDPLTALTVIKRHSLNTLLHLESFDRVVSLAKRYAENSREDFVRLMTKLLNQTHFITSRALQSLDPATVYFPEASDLVQTFKLEEAGHDRLILRSLCALDAEPDLSKVVPGSRHLMDLLARASEISALAFCSVVMFFEGSPFAEGDPYVSLFGLREDCAKAREGVEAHHRINIQGEHSNVGLIFAQRLGAHGLDELESALRLTELTFWLNHAMYCQILDSEGER